MLVLCNVFQNCSLVTENTTDRYVYQGHRRAVRLVQITQPSYKSSIKMESSGTSTNM